MDFQTPSYICEYMASFLPSNAGCILEPTKGMGNIVRAIESKGTIVAPDDFFKMESRKFDWIVMNPPFSPMKLGYKILYSCMEMSENIIALMPWLTLINSEKRTKDIIDFGLISITHLPRNAFKGSRVQTCVLNMKRGHIKDTKFFMIERVFQSK